ncbi:MAG TPA: PilN domain-containing protein [Longimicrobium sp.]
MRGRGWMGSGMGAALGPDGVHALLPDGSGWSHPLEERSEAALEDAFRALRQAAGGTTLHLALLPPLAEVRRIELPRLRDAEVQAVLRRDARRHFASAREPQALAVQKLGPAAAGRIAVLVAAAPEALVQAVWAAAPRAGWRLGGVVPADAAWAAAAAAWLGRGEEGGRLVLPVAGRLHAVELWRGRLAGVRRFPPGAERDDLEVDGATALAGPPEWRSAASLLLEERGARIAAPRSEGAEVDRPELLAADWAPAAGLALVPAGLEAGRSAAARRWAASLAAAAAVLLLAAAALEGWGARRELRAVEAERARLAPAVAQVQSVRGRLDALGTRFATLRALEGGAPAWPLVLASVAQTLPRDAWLTAFRAEGDSVTLEGEARRASRVFEAVSRTPGLTGVRVAAPVRRELTPAGIPMERFVIRAALGAAKPEGAP